ncbi:DUF4864 domain-containing protein [Roseisolibacter sp. H3M3-2]|uniref:DUF4864 domain-containing protein n=1 Tax=Roseisolibacter sp. H3M3-2 TaxID=3031323 RepID=UPI0023D98DFE|nr:DUF4864 domain-containing protein [Roseisolibacter sp. H3M3-2]MDF1503576.1 DUF4864 domain-containing protein [Roseisolibacter sp. H3M3-2]
MSTEPTMRNQPFVRAARVLPSPVPARLARTLAAALMLLSLPVAPAAARAQDALAARPAPAPTLAPDSVVAIVLDAFSRVEGRLPTSALDVAYAFTAPANRAVIGSVERFEDVVADGAYRPLLGHRRAERGAIRVDGDHATQRVVVTAADGARVAYTFTLSRQSDGPFKDCWMTERVTREPPSRLAAPQLAE